MLLMSHLKFKLDGTWSMGNEGGTLQDFTARLWESSVQKQQFPQVCNFVKSFQIAAHWLERFGRNLKGHLVRPPAKKQELLFPNHCRQVSIHPVLEVFQWWRAPLASWFHCLPSVHCSFARYQAPIHKYLSAKCHVSFPNHGGFRVLQKYLEAVI